MSSSALDIKRAKPAADGPGSAGAAPGESVPIRSRAWPAFTEKLTAALQSLQEDQFLILAAKRGCRYVQFACQGSFGMRVETASNHYLSGDERLDERQLAQLAGAGWSPPTRDPARSTAQDDPDGSPNFFFDFGSPVDCRAVAELAVRTLADILRIPHPGGLTYDAFESRKGALQLIGLGLKRAEPRPASPSPEPDLRRSALECVRRTTGIADLDYDENGDITISFKGHPCRLRLVQNGHFARFLSLVARGLADRSNALGLVNELNRSTARLQFWHEGDEVLACMDVAVEPFVSSHLAEAMNQFCRTVHEAAADIQAGREGEKGGALEQPRTVH